MTRRLGGIFAIVAALAAAPSCGGSTESAGGDAGVRDGAPPSGDDGPEAADSTSEADHGSLGCASTADCASGEQCLYRVGDCSAKGQCISVASLGAMCNLVIVYCGCDGESVQGLCGPPYAYGPTLGKYGGCPDAGAADH
jgi:hypothetical protein